MSDKHEVLSKAVEQPRLIYLLGLGVGLGETAEELRAGGSVEDAADYIERVGDTLWAYVGNPRRAPE